MGGCGSGRRVKENRYGEKIEYLEIERERWGDNKNLKEKKPKKQKTKRE